MEKNQQDFDVWSWMEENKPKTLDEKILRDQKNGFLLTGLPDKVDVITVGQEFVINGQEVNISYE